MGDYPKAYNKQSWDFIHVLEEAIIKTVSPLAKLSRIKDL